MLKTKGNPSRIKYQIIKINKNYKYKKIKLLLMLIQIIFIHLVKMTNKITIKVKKKNYKARI